MQENVYYLDLDQNGRNIYVHEYIPDVPNGRGFLFVNPILDEKKRVQRFQAETGRAMSRKGFHIVSCDFYGTGESSGELYEVDFSRSVLDLKSLYGYFIAKYNLREMGLMAVRFGCNLAGMLASSVDAIRHIIFVEPVLDGARYLSEQRIRRNFFFKLNRMTPYQYVTINGVQYEDHQGYPLSTQTIQFIEGQQMKHLSLEEKSIHVFTIGAGTGGNKITEMIEYWRASNKATLTSVRCEPFWSTLEAIDTSNLTNDVVDYAATLEDMAVEKSKTVDAPALGK